MHTLEDLEAAKEEARYWGDAYANDKSNNPNKYETQIRDADIKIRRIESYLKNQGIIPKTPQEVLNEELDRLYPDARSKAVVSHLGKNIRYDTSHSYRVAQEKRQKSGGMTG